MQQLKTHPTENEGKKRKEKTIRDIIFHIAALHTNAAAKDSE